MKNVLRTVMFAVIVCGVFSADEDKVKSVMEGESVTLNPDLTQMQEIIQKKWIFQKKGSTTTENIQYMEILKNRLKIDDQTGSLTISNMRSKHSGIYILRIDLNTGPKDIRFTVNVEEVPSASDIYNIEMKNVSVTKGKPVILQTDITKLHGDELIVWRFGDEGKLLAKEDKETKSPPYYNADERFRDRLQLNNQTGSLTISHTKDTDAGLYTVKINSNEHITYKIITVAVTVPASGVSPGGILVIVLLGIALAAAVVVAVCYCCKISKSRKPIDNISDQIKELPNICNDLKQLSQEKLLDARESISSQEELLKIAKKLEDVSAACDKDLLTISKHLTQLHEDILKILNAALSSRTTSQADPGQDAASNTLLQADPERVEVESDDHSPDAALRTSQEDLVEEAEKKDYTAAEGEDVTIKNKTKLNERDLILWWFGNDNILAINSGRIKQKFDGPDGIFRDRVELDVKSGSLTIKNIKYQHGGEYIFGIIKNKNVIIKKTFTVHIKGPKRK